MNNVEWVLSLKDQFSHVMEGAKERAEQFEHTMGGVIEKVKEFAGAAAAMAGAYEGFEFVKDSVKSFTDAQDAVAQLKAGLESTGGVAGVTFQELTQSAKKFSEQIPFSKAEIMSMQSVLLTFPAITKQTFGDASQAIFDMATRMHQDINSTAIQVGKALQDPIQGITALHRVGVNFNAQQRETIKHLVETGHAAQAQQMILRELTTEFGGSAAAAARTFSGQMKILSNQFDEVKEQLGGMIARIVTHLKPTIEWMITAFGNLLSWVKRNKELLERLAIAVGVITAAFLVYDAALWGIAVVTKAVTIATQVWTAVQWALNAAMEANPIVWIITGIAAVVAGVIAAYHHFAMFRAVLWATWGVIKEFGRIVKDVFFGIATMMAGITHFNLSEIKAGWGQAADAIGNAAQRIGKAASDGYAAGMADFAKDQVADPNSKHDQGTGKPKPGPMTAAAPTGPVSTSPGNKVSGQKILNIAITINGGLAPHMSFNVTNIQESASKIKEMVSRALLSAVNDSQIIGDH